MIDIVDYGNRILEHIDVRRGLRSDLRIRYKGG